MLRPYAAHWETRLERRASGTSVRGRHGALQAEGKVYIRPASSHQQESKSISHSSTTLTLWVLQIEQKQKPEAHSVSTAHTSREHAKLDSAWHDTVVARSSPSSLRSEMEQDTRKPAAALRLVQDACRSESLRAHEYGSKSELFVAQTAPVWHEEKAVKLYHSRKELLPQSLSRRRSTWYLSRHFLDLNVSIFWTFIDFDKLWLSSTLTLTLTLMDLNGL